MYADDHHVYQTGSNVKAIISEKEAENVSHWYIGTLVHWYNLLHANSKKVPSFSIDAAKQ